MDRTQIYLTDAQTRELDRRAKQRGTTRSHLIREAVDEYLRPVQDPAEFKAALDAVAGMWADRDDVEPTYAELKRRSRAKLAGYARRRPHEDREGSERS
jgi:metal-responsive CopG/Arc/MetJ family transcriptional regulator